MNAIRDIPYIVPGHPRQAGDVFLPDTPSGRAPALLIHGGGWNALNRTNFECVVKHFVAAGRAVFNINYRLLDHAPWPACGDDCLAAARFLLDGGLAAAGIPAPERIVICGASAGGHLAMMTGLGLPPERVAAILSMAGPSHLAFREGSCAEDLPTSRFRRRFFGAAADATREQIEGASPACRVRPGAPPLFCIHSANDTLVPPAHSEMAVEAWRRVGSRAELRRFDGPGRLHGFFTSDDLDSREIIPAVAEIIARLLTELP